MLTTHLKKTPLSCLYLLIQRNSFPKKKKFKEIRIVHKKYSLWIWKNINNFFNQERIETIDLLFNQVLVTFNCPPQRLE